MKEAIIYNITEEGETMTREQQEEVKEIINGLGGTISADGEFEGCTLYTTDIERILQLDALLMYHDCTRRFTIGNWTPDPPPKPEAQKTMSVSAFDGHYNIELRVVADSMMDHDHLELWHNEHKLGYMHLQYDTIHWCPSDHRQRPQWIDINREQKDR